MRKHLLLILLFSYTMNISGQVAHTNNFLDNDLNLTNIPNEHPMLLKKLDDHKMKEDLILTEITRATLPEFNIRERETETKILAQKREIIEKLKSKNDLKGDATFVSESDSLALVALNNSTDGDNWTDNTNWLTGPVNSWYGIDVSEGTVISIKLENNNLSGIIPSELGNLTSLTSLRLSDNQLTGTIPSELGNLSNLQSLNLSFNQLIGTIPSRLGDLSNLRYLNLSSNQFTGMIPQELGNLFNLQQLNIYLNQLTDTIPSELGNLTNLQQLDLEYNQLTGTIPKELGSLTSLTNLWLSHNQLTGTIPSELGNLSSLESLALGSNQLTSSIPSELANLANLQILHLNYNQLTGAIPPELGNLSNLQDLFINDNQLTGTIPSELGNLASLTGLLLSNNQLTGTIPSELGNLDLLSVLLLDNNQLTGTIPTELGNLSNLQSLLLSDNQLTGTIPLELTNLSNLMYLDLGSNQLTGSIPVELGILSNMEILFLENNYLTGSIPSELGNLSKLRYLYLDNNQLTGIIPTELGNLSNFEYLRLQNNQLTGIIPSEFNNLLNLKHLYIHNNKLTACSDLSALNLDYNYIYNNEFTFGDLETLNRSLENANDFYWPQAELPIPTQTDNGNGTTTFSFTTDGTGNTYQWYKNAIEITGETTNTLTIDNSESGIFYCEIKNSNFSKLTLSTKAIFYNNTTEDHGVTQEEYSALVALYNATNGDNWDINTNWLSSEDVTDWYGVTVVGGHVSKIDLYKNNLEGEIPTEIGDFNNLLYLRLAYNNLNGAIPAEIGNLSKLQYLRLYNNNLSGTLPSEIGNLTELLDLSIGHNQFSGTIPVSLANLSGLQHLWLYQNQFSGSIPSELGDLNNLSYLILWDNGFTGSVPASFKNLVNLEYLYLHETNLSDLPDLSALVNLIEFYTYDSYFTFEDFENTNLNFSLLTTGYSPQANLEMQNHEVYLSEGDDYTLNCTHITTENLTSPNNLYAIYRDGQLVRDYSGDPVYTINSCSDGDTGEYTIKVKNNNYSELTLSCDTMVIDVNSIPTDIALSNNTVDENVAVGTLVGELSATDPDADETFTYSLASGDGSNDADNTSFNIDGSSLKTARALDYETKSTHHIYIEVEDAGGLTYQKAFVINVNDIAETGIHEVDEMLVNVYPNPSNGIFTLKTNINNCKVEVYDVIGNKVYNSHIGSDNKIIDLTNEAKGLYFIRISKNGNIYNQRIILK